jgi:hypothetical protein
LPRLSGIVSKMLPHDALRIAFFDQRGRLLMNASTADVPEMTESEAEDVIIDDLRGTRCSPHFTQDVSIGWTVTADGRGPRLSVQLDVQNLSNKVHLLSKESTMVQGQYSTPRVFSGSLKVAF